MAPIPGPKPQTDAELADEARDWNQKFDEAFLPSVKEIVTGILTGIGIIALVILPPWMCAVISNIGR